MNPAAGSSASQPSPPIIPNASSAISPELCSLVEDGSSPPPCRETAPPNSTSSSPAPPASRSTLSSSPPDSHSPATPIFNFATSATAAVISSKSAPSKSPASSSPSTIPPPLPATTTPLSPAPAEREEALSGKKKRLEPEPLLL